MRKRISDKLTYRCNTCGMVFEKEVKNVVDSLPYCSQKCWGKAKSLGRMAPDMLAMLKRLEWTFEHEHCAVCGRGIQAGHTQSCELAKLLTLADGVSP